jgi:hypothetical protein
MDADSGRQATTAARRVVLALDGIMNTAFAEIVMCCYTQANRMISRENNSAYHPAVGGWADEDSV